MKIYRNYTEKEIKLLIRAEVIGNIFTLIDPKKKDSFSDSRVHTFGDLVSDRLYLHLFGDVNS